MSDKYDDDDFESSATTSQRDSTPASSKATSRSASASSAAASKASMPFSHSQSSASGADASREASHHSYHSDSAHSESQKRASVSSNDESTPASTSSSSSAATSPSASHRSSHSRPKSASASGISSRPSSVSHKARATGAEHAAVMPAAEADNHRVAAAADSQRSAASRGGARAARQAEEVPVSPVPDTQEQLDDMLVDNEDLRERLFELQRRRYRDGLSSTRQAPASKKEETAAAVQASLANERLAQILRAERKDLRQKRDYLQELVRRYKKATKYRDLIEEAKDDIDVLCEENRDLQLEVRCNEKLLVANAEANESGMAAHRLQEELRARNALTERGVQHALRDADEAERLRDSVQQRVDKLREELEARRNAPSSRHLDQLEEAREDNRAKRARVRALEAQLARIQGQPTAATSAAARTSMSLRTEAEREYLCERIAAMRDEIHRMKNPNDLGDAEGNGESGAHQLSSVLTPNHATAPATHDANGYPSALQAHEKEISASANASRRQSTAAPTQNSAAATWLDEAGSRHNSVSNGGQPATSHHASMTSQSHTKLSGSGQAVHAAAPLTTTAAAVEEDPFFAAAFGDDTHPAAPAPPAEPAYDLSAPAAGAPEDDWLLDALRKPASETEPAGASPMKTVNVHDEAPDWLAGEVSAGEPNNAPVDELKFTEEPVDDIFADTKFAAPAPAPAAAAPAVTTGGDDVPDWLQF